MRFPIAALLLIASTGTSLLAQGDFILYPTKTGNSTTFVDRFSTSAVEVLQGLHRDNFAGIGDNGTTCEVNSVYHWAVDENPSTTETYSVVFRSQEATSRRPDLTPSGLIASAGPFTSPPNPTTTRATFFVTDTFATPITIPCQGGVFVGLDLPASPNWPASDGHAVYVAWYYPPATSPLGDNPRFGAPRTAFGNTSGTLVRPQSNLLLRIGMLVDSAVLNIGGIDPAATNQMPAGSNYGAGGLYPDISGMPRSDGLDVMIEDQGKPNGMAALFMSTGITSLGGINLAPITGQLWLDPLAITPLTTGSLDAAGIGVIPLAPPGSIPSGLVGGDIAFQAVTFTIPISGPKTTNVQVVHF